MPPTQAKIHSVAEVMLPRDTPINMPMKQSIEDKQLYMMACLTDMPARNKTAKSPEK